MYESYSSQEHEIIKLPEPLLFEEFKNVDLKLGETHKLFIKISQEFGDLLKNRSENECYSDGALFWQHSIPIWQKSAGFVLSAIGDSSPPWFMFLKSFPYGEKEFFLQSHPMQNLFHPFIQGFEQELAQCEWAYELICFDDGE